MGSDFPVKWTMLLYIKAVAYNYKLANKQTNWWNMKACV